MRSVFRFRKLYILDAAVEHTQIRKIDVRLVKYGGYVFGQIFNRDVFGWFACGDQNSEPANQSRFPQFRIIERFCVEGSNKLSDCGAL